jgi:endonuclease/exonuclease/phosphatase (EEP) superfamily protein YafD
MKFAYLVISGLLVATNLLPFVRHQHWFFRGFDFGKVQFFFMQLVAFAMGWLIFDRSCEMMAAQALLFGCLAYNGFILFKYTFFYKPADIEVFDEHSDSVTLLSANIYQYNREYERFLDLVRRTQPDLVLTMESNMDWDRAMSPLEKEYPYYCKVPLENTYGMHLYSKLKMTSHQVHYFVADDLPCIEASLLTREGYHFTLFAVHPPPPSPTEEANSKERDGELLSVAKKMRKNGHTTVVVGDFNNVAWARSSVLFRRTSETVDRAWAGGSSPLFMQNTGFFAFLLTSSTIPRMCSCRN